MAEVKKYWVEEWSQDTRHYAIDSNYELDSEILEATYWQGIGSLDSADINKEEDITEEVVGEMQDRGYETIPKDLKVIVKFTGTEYGDDTQTCSGEFAVRKDCNHLNEEHQSIKEDMEGLVNVMEEEDVPDYGDRG